MIAKRRPFPLVADDEPVMQPPRQMQLYENDDLITHSRGGHHDKPYQDKGRVLKPDPVVQQTVASSPVRPSLSPSEASKAREEARRAIRQKRQAMMEHKPLSSATSVSKTKLVKSPAKPRTSELSQFSKVLEQETYILADLPTRYTQPQNPTSRTVTKNNYDFLKKSQIYNYQERQSQKERQVAQELNLTRFED